VAKLNKKFQEFKVNSVDENRKAATIVHAPTNEVVKDYNIDTLKRFINDRINSHQNIGCLSK